MSCDQCSKKTNCFVVFSATTKEYHRYLIEVDICKEYLHQHLNFQQEKVLFYFHRWENICKTHGFLCTILSERQKI